MWHGQGRTMLPVGRGGGVQWQAGQEDGEGAQRGRDEGVAGDRETRVVFK
jgi:hypothetical protein